jgi:hypothetical protein
VERVTGIGGVFFRASDPVLLATWYQQHLGVDCGPQGDVVWEQQAGPTVWAPFPPDSDYLGGPEQQVMINFRVRDLDAMIAQLHRAGIETEAGAEASDFGRFAHLRDPAGTRIELWEVPDDGS